MLYTPTSDNVNGQGHDRKAQEEDISLKELLCVTCRGRRKKKMELN
jgi:hypothetical protein